MDEESKILNQESKISLESMDIAQKKREQLKALFPEVFAENKIDFDQLKRVLGEWIEPSTDSSGKERFGLNWPGKAECMKIIQQPSIATLKPARDESVHFDDTENLFIEGDNLEVLKFLQKSYFGKVKMIYIDPPYNTGKEFIYPDKFSETLETYLEYTGQKDSNGRKFSTNTETAGRYHSNWLNMMYPRLYLACSLLREDGVIFISIDDNEQANLKTLCDQIFGEENFVAEFPWRKRTGKNDVPFGVSRDYEYVLCYAKNGDFVASRKIERKYYKSADYPNDEWRLNPMTKQTTAEQRPNSYFTIINPKNGEEFPASKKRTWSITRKTFTDYHQAGKIVFPRDYDFLNIKQPMLRIFKSDEIKNKGEDWNKTAVSTHLDVGMNSEGNKEMGKLFEEKIFDFPKPSSLIKHFATIGSKDSDIILDFFAGSCTTAHAVMALNAEDGGNRKYIMVQLPEPCNEKSEAYKAGYKTIADIGKERIRRAAKKIEKEQNDQLNLNGATKPDLGFKVFKLSPSNFKIWEGNIEKARLDKIENLEQQIFNHVDHIDATSTAEDILYEILLQNGFLLSTQVEIIQLAGKEVFSIEDRALLICLDKNLTQEVIDAIVNEKPLQIIFLDEGFKGNDQLKINTFQTFKARAKEEDSEIVCITV